MKKKLVEFYESKYAEDAQISKLDMIDYKNYPLNRFETCFKWFSDNFEGGAILEIGAGNGYLANSLLKSNSNIDKYTITDISVNRLHSVRAAISDNRLEAEVVDAENYDFESSGKYDAIIMMAIIEHFIDPLNTMKEIRKALKPDGIVYIDTPNIAEYGCRFKLLRGRFPSTASRNEGLITYDGRPVALHDEGHLHYFTYRSLTELLIKYAGFKSVSKYYQISGRIYLGHRIHQYLAKKWPELFSTLILIAQNEGLSNK